jgi:hypothetical protein
MCSKCGEAPVGPRGILCPACVELIESQPSLGES